MATCSGCGPTATTPRDASEDASRIETEESSRFETTRIFPDGATRAIQGRRPARPRATIWREAQSIATIALDPDAAT